MNKKTTQQPRAAVYLRTARDDALGSAIQQQRAACEQFAADHSITVTQIYVDIGSGSRFKRPGLDRMLADLETEDNVRYVIGFDLARLARNNEMLGQISDKLWACGVDVVTITTNGRARALYSLTQLMADLVAATQRKHQARPHPTLCTCAN